MTEELLKKATETSNSISNEKVKLGKLEKMMATDIQKIEIYEKNIVGPVIMYIGTDYKTSFRLFIGNMITETKNKINSLEKEFQNL